MTPAMNTAFLVIFSTFASSLAAPRGHLKAGMIDFNQKFDFAQTPQQSAPEYGKPVYSPYQAEYGSPYGLKYEASDEAPYEGQYETPYGAIYGTQYRTPYIAPNGPLNGIPYEPLNPAPYETPNAVPCGAPNSPNKYPFFRDGYKYSRQIAW